MEVRAGYSNSCRGICPHAMETKTQGVNVSSSVTVSKKFNL